MFVQDLVIGNRKLGLLQGNIPALHYTTILIVGHIKLAARVRKEHCRVPHKSVSLTVPSKRQASFGEENVTV